MWLRELRQGRTERRASSAEAETPLGSPRICFPADLWENPPSARSNVGTATVLYRIAIHMCERVGS